MDETTQAAIEKRGRELIGLAMLSAAIALALILASYVPDDPSWLSATDEPARNILGRFGASIASPLVVIVGWGAWGLVLVFLAWGARFVLHRGIDQALPRLIFAPIAVALAAVYASTHVPMAGWTHSFGLGGLFGDTVLGAILGVAPVQATFGLKVLSVIMGAGMLALGAYVLGFTKPELKAIGRFLLVGLIVTYAALLSLFRRGAYGAVEGATKVNQRMAERRSAREAEALAYAEAVPSPETPRAASRLRMPKLTKRVAEPPLAAPQEPVESAGAEDDDRVRARIAGAIRARMRGHEPLRIHNANAGRSEPPLTRPHRREPLIAGKVRIEPPVVDSAAMQAVKDSVDDYLDTYEDTYDEADLTPELVTAAQARAMAPQTTETRRLVQQPVRKAPVPSRMAQAEAQPKLALEPVPDEYENPPLSLLMSPDTVERHHLPDEALEENARMLENVLDDYGVKGEIVSVRPGPVVTMYELEPAPGLKASRVIGLADDIARSMSALSARVSTVPGRSVIGIELPNVNREKVVLREILSARDFGDSNMRLPLALGKDIGGDAVVANLAKMPHHKK